MQFSAGKAARRLIVAILCGLAALPMISVSQTADNTDARTQRRMHARAKYGLEGRLDPDEHMREIELKHQFNRQRVARTHPLGAEGLGAEATSVDINDLAVIENDGTMGTIAGFDLTGKAVQFTPSGAAYTISTGNAAWETNFGTKLDMTMAPAVNPAPDADPGDDAYVMQDLGFSFSFYGVSYTQVAVGSNGFLTFRPADTTDTVFDRDSVDSAESLTRLQTRLPRIAAYWHDLDTSAPFVNGANGIYIRRDSDRVVITWNNVADWDDTGVHRFQITLARDGRITMGYDQIQLTTTALTGLTPGRATASPVLVDFSSPASTAFSAPVAEFFTRNPIIDEVAIARTFYATHPNRDVYDFLYILTDYPFDNDGAYAFYAGLSNEVTGINITPFNSPNTKAFIGSQRLQGFLNLNDILSESPEYPSDRIPGFFVDSPMSVWAQEQGHRWLARPRFTGASPNILVGRANSHWSFFHHVESSLSVPAARRSSSLEGSAWRDNNDGSFTTTALVDGFSPLDLYLMGLRTPSEVPDGFYIASPTGTSITASDFTRPNITVQGTKTPVSIAQIVEANGDRTPDAATAPKKFRAAFILFTQKGTTPLPTTLARMTRFRLAWESYFALSTDFRASIDTGLADSTDSRIIAATSSADFRRTLVPGALTSLFGTKLTSGGSAGAAAQPLPTILAGTRVLVNGVPAPLLVATPGQINFQMPRNTVAVTNNPLARNYQSSSITIEVISDGQVIRAGVFQIAPSIPSVF
ncbi:MAG: hypothetical protein ACKV2V_10520, partial [Blastocatellia bacterium]